MVQSKVGFRRDRLEVIEYLGKLKYNKHWWKCICDCGNTICLTSAKVKTGPISCGCLRVEKLLSIRFDGIKHGLHKHRLYSIYYSMLQRCYNEKATRYEYYGGKNVKVCDDWKCDFTVFYNWALDNGYEGGLCIDRIDSNGNYCPVNCQWITLEENTRRSNVSLVRADDGTYRKRTEGNLSKS